MARFGESRYGKSRLFMNLRFSFHQFMPETHGQRPSASLTRHIFLNQATQRCHHRKLAKHPKEQPENISTKEGYTPIRLMLKKCWYHQTKCLSVSFTIAFKVPNPWRGPKPRNPKSKALSRKANVAMGSNSNHSSVKREDAMVCFQNQSGRNRST